MKRCSKCCKFTLDDSIKFLSVDLKVGFCSENERLMYAEEPADNCEAFCSLESHLQSLEIDMSK